MISQCSLKRCVLPLAPCRGQGGTPAPPTPTAENPHTSCDSLPDLNCPPVSGGWCKMHVIRISQEEGRAQQSRSWSAPCRHARTYASGDIGPTPPIALLSITRTKHKDVTATTRQRVTAMTTSVLRLQAVKFTRTHTSNTKPYIVWGHTCRQGNGKHKIKDRCRFQGEGRGMGPPGTHGVRMVLKTPGG